MKKVLSGKLARSVSGALSLNILEAGLGFLTAMVLGQLMGAASYGIYSYTIALAGILVIIGLLGQDRYAVREIAKLNAEGNTIKVKQFIFSTFTKVSLLTLVICIIASILLYSYHSHFSEIKRNAFIVGIFVFVLTVYMRLYISFFQGIQKVITSLYADKLIRPLSFLLLVLVTNFILNVEMTAEVAVAANASAAAIALVVIVALWHRQSLYSINNLDICNKQLLTNWKPALPFALLAGMGVINQNIDVLILGIYASDADIGIYRISSRVATLIAFALTAVNAAFGPNISALFAKSDFKQLQNNASKAALASTLVAFPCFLIFVFAGSWVLLLFGPDFTSGTNVLTILSVGQFINALSGAVALLLMMTEHAKKAANSLLFSVVLNALLNVILIPKYGVIGAAYATSISVILLNLVNIYWVWHYLRINPTVLGFVFKKY